MILSELQRVYIPVGEARNKHEIISKCEDY